MQEEEYRKVLVASLLEIFQKCSPLPTSEACGCVPPSAHHRIDLNASTRCLDPLDREPTTRAIEGKVLYTSSTMCFYAEERVCATCLGVASACTFPSIWPSVLILWRRHRPMFTRYVHIAPVAFDAQLPCTILSQFVACDKYVSSKLQFGDASSRLAK